MTMIQVPMISIKKSRPIGVFPKVSKKTRIKE